eukprot:5661493-Amphidinium_carterae.2
MTEDQVRMFLKEKGPMVQIEDDADDEAFCRAAAAASTTGSEEPDTSRSEEPEASSSEEQESSSSE